MLFFLDPSTAQQPGLLEWLIKYALPGLGWPTLILIAWKISRYLTKAEDKAKETIDSAVADIEANTKTIKSAGESLSRLADTFEQHTKDDDRNFKDIYGTLKEHREESRAMLELLSNRTMLFGDVSKAIQSLAEAIHHQSDVHASQFEVIRGIAERQATLAANQEHITQGFQRVVEQLIQLMRE